MSQKVQLINQFSYLQSDIVNMIIKYLDVIAYRNGKYIDRINKQDNRYIMLLRVPRPIKVSNNQYYLGLREYPRLGIKFSLTYIINENNVSIYTTHYKIENKGMIYRSQRQTYINSSV